MGQVCKYIKGGQDESSTHRMVDPILYKYKKNNEQSSVTIEKKIKKITVQAGLRYQVRYLYNKCQVKVNVNLGNCNNLGSEKPQAVKCDKRDKTLKLLSQIFKSIEPKCVLNKIKLQLGTQSCSLGLKYPLALKLGTVRYRLIYKCLTSEKCGSFLLSLRIEVAGIQYN